MADEFEKRVIRLRKAIKRSRNDADDGRFDGCSAPRATPQLLMPLPQITKVTHNHGEALQISVSFLFPRAAFAVTANRHRPADRFVVLVLVNDFRTRLQYGILYVRIQQEKRTLLLTVPGHRNGPKRPESAHAQQCLECLQAVFL